MSCPSVPTPDVTLAAIPGVLIYKDFFRLIRVTFRKNTIQNQVLEKKRPGTAVPFGKTQIALEQNRLWQKNYECSKGEFLVTKNAYNVEVGTVICSSR